MALVTYPLNNIEYSAEDAELFHTTRTSGVYSESSFDYSVTGADNNVVIGTGIGWIKNSEFSGKVIAQKEAVSLDIGLPDSVYPRIDAIIIQFDSNRNETNIVVKKGVASSNPVAPLVVQNESVYELHLYHVLREAGSLYITPSNITDLRLDSSYCGLMVDSVTNVDTTAIENQVSDLIRSLQDEISNVIDGSAYILKTGGKMTGNLTASGVIVKNSNPVYEFQNPDETTIGSLRFANNRHYLRSNAPDTEFYEQFRTPAPNTGLTESKSYDILTTKAPVTIEQGGTGAATVEDALTNLGAMPVFKASLSNCSEDDIVEPGGYAIASANVSNVTGGAPELANFSRSLFVFNFDTSHTRVLQLECRAAGGIDLPKYTADLFYRIITNGTPKTIQPWRRISTNNYTYLWKNASPSSAFAAQTLTVSGLSDCCAVIINFHATEGSARMDSVFVTKKGHDGDRVRVQRIARDTVGNVGVYDLERPFVVSFESGTVKFEDATQNDAVTNTRQIPYEIIGIKGVM